MKSESIAAKALQDRKKFEESVALIARGLNDAFIREGWQQYCNIRVVNIKDQEPSKAAA